MTRPFQTHWAMAALCLALAACGGTPDPSVERFNQVVSPMQTDETADVPALVLARAMAEAGFSRAQILDYGPSVRNALARSGGAQIADGSTVLALVSVLDGRLYIVSNETGNVVIPISGVPE
ncbi:MAG: hypothetical protein AAF913_12790 [Pseudomonadota bacterium]